jgi:serine acetyltransferase
MEQQNVASLPNIPHAASTENLSFLDLVAEDWRTHDRDWTKSGFKALLVYRFGIWRMSLRRTPLRGLLGYAQRFMFRRACWRYGIEIYDSAKLGRRIRFEHPSGIVIHGDSIIGDDVVIRQQVTLGIRRLDHLHDAPVIGNRVDIGAGAKILGRVVVGDGAVIGANAVVLEDVPPGSLAVGVPARIVTR